MQTNLELQNPHKSPAQEETSAETNVIVLSVKTMQWKMMRIAIYVVVLSAKSMSKRNRFIRLPTAGSCDLGSR